MMRFQFQPKDIFTVFIIVIIMSSIAIASHWVLRASIIILVLGSIGALLATMQLLIDCTVREVAVPKTTPKFELPSYDHSDIKTATLRTLEIWGWLIGLVAAIPILGLPVVLPLFVLIYVKFYGGSWLIASVLAALIGAFIFGIYQQIMHVYWPDSLLGDIFLGE